MVKRRLVRVPWLLFMRRKRWPRWSPQEKTLNVSYSHITLLILCFITKTPSIIHNSKNQEVLLTFCRPICLQNLRNKIKKRNNTQFSIPRKYQPSLTMTKNMKIWKNYYRGPASSCNTIKSKPIKRSKS